MSNSFFITTLVDDFTDIYVKGLSRMADDQKIIMLNHFKKTMIKQFKLKDINEFIPIYGTDLQLFHLATIFDIQDHAQQLANDEHRKIIGHFFDSDDFKSWHESYIQLQEKIQSIINEVQEQRSEYMLYFIY